MNDTSSKAAEIIRGIYLQLWSLFHTTMNFILELSKRKHKMGIIILVLFICLVVLLWMWWEERKP